MTAQHYQISLLPHRLLSTVRREIGLWRFVSSLAPTYYFLIACVWDLEVTLVPSRPRAVLTLRWLRHKVLGLKVAQCGRALVRFRLGGLDARTAALRHHLFIVAGGRARANRSFRVDFGIGALHNVFSFFLNSSLSHNVDKLVHHLVYNQIKQDWCQVLLKVSFFAGLAREGPGLTPPQLPVVPFGLLRVRRRLFNCICKSVLTHYFRDGNNTAQLLLLILE